MNSFFPSTDRYARAVAFACRCHARQYRDDGKTPYSVHPVRVTEHLRRIARETDEDVLVAALLHDTIEDAAVTYDSIEKQFGAVAAGLVAEVTNDNRLPKNERREQMLAHISQLSPNAKRIKLADRLDNVLDLLTSGGPAAKRERYIRETERILNGCNGSCPELEDALRNALHTLKTVSA